MTKTDQYIEKLNSLPDKKDYLLQASGLPGPRGNLELAAAMAKTGCLEEFLDYIRYTQEQAPVNSPYEFLVFCGVLGLGRLAAEGAREYLPVLRSFANDPRWRTREAVAMGLQLIGDSDMDFLLSEMQAWCRGSAFEQRAVAAGLCEPRLLKNPEHCREVLAILDRITASILQQPDRKREGFLALKKGLGYCWSVATATLPAEGTVIMEKWLSSDDQDIRWIMRENLKKNRLIRVAPEWVKQYTECLQKHTE